MSYLRMPDPHPGRCENFRTRVGPHGVVETLRCLDYEGVPHACSFPPPRPRETGRDWGAGSVYTPPKPRPWVKPSDPGEGTTP